MLQGDMWSTFDVQVHVQVAVNVQVNGHVNVQVNGHVNATPVTIGGSHTTQTEIPVNEGQFDPASERPVKTRGLC